MIEVIDNWPDCPVEGCPNKICLALNSDKCFPHTPGNQHVKRWKIDARNVRVPFAVADHTPIADAVRVSRKPKTRVKESPPSSQSAV